jgi:predicted O-methyltransferase YrrM
MSFLQQLRRRVRIPVDLARELNHKMDALIEGSANESRILNEKSKAIIEGINNQTRILGAKLDAVVAQSRQLNVKLDALIAALNVRSPRSPADTTTALAAGITNIVDAALPSGALIADNTYDTSHPDYDVAVVRNFPGKILNRELRCTNAVYAEITKLADGDVMTDKAWAPVLQNALAEAKTVPHADLVLQRRETLEQYFAELARRYNAHYMAGSVNFDDALFLYWLVRKLNPKTVVQCGVCNGLSSAFIMLALAKNGSDGRIFAIDLPPVFNPKDPGWTSPGRTYGIVIPEGKTSGWIVPEAYRKRFEVQNGDSKLLLPPLVERLSTIDMFFHDSDHTYNHMMFEFREAKRKLAPGGLIVADDISWNASLWDLADESRVPAYNFKGSVGAAFF